MILWKEPQDGSKKRWKGWLLPDFCLFLAGLLMQQNKKQVSWVWGFSLSYTLSGSSVLDCSKLCSCPFSCGTYRQDILIACLSLRFLWVDWRSHGKAWFPIMQCVGSPWVKGLQGLELKKFFFHGTEIIMESGVFSTLFYTSQCSCS